jgi:trehalose-6-phosphate synthase
MLMMLLKMMQLYLCWLEMLTLEQRLKELLLEMLRDDAMMMIVTPMREGEPILAHQMEAVGQAGRKNKLVLFVNQ